MTRIDDVAVIKWLSDGWMSSSSGSLFHILHASWVLLSLGVGLLKLLLIGFKRKQVGTCTQSWSSYTQLVLIKSAKIEIFHSLLYLMVFINKYILLSFPFTSGVSCLSGWSIVLMHITWMVKCCLCYFISGCKQLFGKVRNFGRSVHTLIHPPSVWVLCPTKGSYWIYRWTYRQT